ncbi:MAG: type II toxin-antitoxin system RelE/ParE family toxin [Ginsengibacter sp.]
MAYKIVWSKNSLQDFNGIIKYLVSQWTLSVASDFVDIVEVKLENLSKQPLVGIRSEKNPLIRSILYLHIIGCTIRLTKALLNYLLSLTQEKILKKILSKIVLADLRVSSVLSGNRQIS